MKQEIYFKNITSHKSILLHKEKDGDYMIYVITLGSHPCAYIELPKQHPLYGKHYNNDGFPYIDVHGGITYSENCLRVDENVLRSSWFLGWDYAHCGDYVNFGFEEDSTKDKKWKLAEIIEHAKMVIKQLEAVK